MTAGDVASGVSPGVRPVVLAVAEDFRSLLGPLGWLYEAGYDVRACLGPLGADRVCGLFEDGCPELAACDLLITNEPPPRTSRGLPPPRDVVSEARLRREELPILVVSDDPGRGRSAADAFSVRVTTPARVDVLEAVRALAGSPPA